MNAGRPARKTRDPGRLGKTQADSRDVDGAAAKRLLEHIRGTLECLTADVINFQNALDGPPGMLAELADKVLDRE